MKKVYGEMQKVCLGPKATKAYDKTFRESVKVRLVWFYEEFGTTFSSTLCQNFGLQMSM